MQDDGGRYIGPAIPMLRKIGAINVKKTYRGSYCLVGKVGRKRRTGLVRQVQKKRGRGPSEIKFYYRKPSMPPFGSMLSYNSTFFSVITPISKKVVF